MNQANQLPEQLVDANAIARILNVSPIRVRERAKANKLPFRKLGDSTRPRLRFYESEVRAHLDGAILKVITNGVTIIKEDK